jgi:hypothetical protein
VTNYGLGLLGGATAVGHRGGQRRWGSDGWWFGEVMGALPQPRATDGR